MDIEMMSSLCFEEVGILTAREELSVIQPYPFSHINSRNEESKPFCALRTDCLNAQSRRSTRVLQRLNSAVRLIQRTTHGGSSRHYVLHRT